MRARETADPLDRALAVVERRLAGSEWLTDAGTTIADIALFAYTQVAEEGEFDLSPYPGLRAWLARVCAQPVRPLPSRASHRRT